ncbi:2-oxoglutarate ferredoxin oxidoreductase subunit beta [Staphylococcus gallinarum]|uniref:2-oxoglutarate ferredoxin oxidoreductase subunit beta n=1 Tax=Staphylococcus gallinarum TaxID=1293 RepID=A0A380FF31_STAGA|nr:2-oxoglutarate ferredoxin oxidoreductase subunit beta [Staphylococcus gallinarum]
MILQIKTMATQKVLEYNSLVKGIVYQDTDTPSFESQIDEMSNEALAKQDIHLDETQFNELTKQFV